MNTKEVITLLKSHSDPRALEHWDKQRVKAKGLKSYGVGLTVLRKLAKQIGRDRELAAKLWKSNYYEAKIIGLLIDDPKQLTREQAEAQVEGLAGGYLAHVFSSCDATLAKSPLAFSLACDWIEHADPIRRRCGYGLMYELSKKNPKGMDDAFLISLIDRIVKEIHGEDMWVRESMNTSLMGIGKRNPVLNKAAIKAAKEIGKVDIDYGPDNSCEPLDVLKHLTGDHLKAKFAKMK